jgi:hypothetical protein
MSSGCPRLHLRTSELWRQTEEDVYLNLFAEDFANNESHLGSLLAVVDLTNIFRGSAEETCILEIVAS